MNTKIYHFEDFEIILVKIWIKNKIESTPAIRQTISKKKKTIESEIEFNNESSRDEYFLNYSDENAKEFIKDYLEALKEEEIMDKPIDLVLRLSSKEPSIISEIISFSQGNHFEKNKIRLGDKIFKNISIVNTSISDNDDMIILEVNMKCDSIEEKKSLEDEEKI